VLKTVGATGLLKEMLSKVEGIEIAFIYGSLARAEERPGSDIDLLIVGRADEDSLVTEIKKAEDLLKREINYVIFSRSEFEKKRKEGDSFIKELLNSPKIFLVGSHDEL